MGHLKSLSFRTTFHTMIHCQPEMTETMKLKLFYSVSQATAEQKWHKLVFDPNTIKLRDSLDELKQGSEICLVRKLRRRLIAYSMLNFQKNCNGQSIWLDSETLRMMKLSRT